MITVEMMEWTIKNHINTVDTLEAAFKQADAYKELKQKYDIRLLYCEPAEREETKADCERVRIMLTAAYDKLAEMLGERRRHP